MGMPVLSMTRNTTVQAAKYTLPLPTDILLEIFTLVDKPVKLTQVCSNWRSLAIDYPLLWTDITVDHRCSRRDIYLLRSRSSPLSVSSKKSCIIYRNCAKCAQSLKVILEHIGRIRTLEIDMNATSRAYLLECFAERKAHILRVLCLKSLYEWEMPHQTHLYIKHSLPMLRVLSLTHLPIQCVPTTLHKLTHLTLKLPYFTTFLGPQDDLLGLKSFISSLKQCSQLEDLSVEAREYTADHGVAVPQSLPEGVVHLPFLSRICLKTVSPRLCVYLADKIKSSRQIEWTIGNTLEYWSHNSTYTPLRTLLENLAISIADNVGRQRRSANRALSLRLDNNDLRFALFCDFPNDGNSAIKTEDDSDSLIRFHLIGPYSLRNNTNKLSNAAIDIVKLIGNMCTLSHLDIDYTESFLLGLKKNINGTGWRKSQHWKLLLENLTMLEDLRVRLPVSLNVYKKNREIITELLRALTNPALSTNMPNGFDTVSICPQLKSLVLAHNKELVSYIPDWDLFTISRRKVVSRCPRRAPLVYDSRVRSICLTGFTDRTISRRLKCKHVARVVVDGVYVPHISGHLSLCCLSCFLKDTSVYISATYDHSVVKVLLQPFFWLFSDEVQDILMVIFTCLRIVFVILQIAVLLTCCYLKLKGVQDSPWYEAAHEIMARPL